MPGTAEQMLSARGGGEAGGRQHSILVGGSILFLISHLQDG